MNRTTAAVTISGGFFANSVRNYFIWLFVYRSSTPNLVHCQSKFSTRSGLIFTCQRRAYKAGGVRLRKVFRSTSDTMVGSAEPLERKFWSHYFVVLAVPASNH